MVFPSSFSDYPYIAKRTVLEFSCAKEVKGSPIPCMGWQAQVNLTDGLAAAYHDFLNAI
jgi:hypothetical protein